MPFTDPNNRDLTPDEVRTIQTQLHAQGFDPGPIDGLYGRRTAAAIIAFKRSLGFVPRVWVGPLTWEALHTMGPPRRGSETGLIVPPWVEELLKIKGWHERRENARLRAWLASDGHALGDPAVFPWCGDAVETAIRLALPGEPLPGPLGRNPYWALNWRYLGAACGPVFGAVAAFPRAGGGHVAFAVGEDSQSYHLLGGNQSDTVSIVPVAKSRVDAASWRWPTTWGGPQQPLPAGHTLSAEGEVRFS